MTKHNKKCSIDGCDRKHHAKSWCQLHYGRWFRNGDPEFASYVKTETPEESFALRTEWQGDCLIWTGSRSKHGYGVIRVDGRLVYIHHYTWERANGPIPEGMKIDHKNHCDPACCNVDHLRLATAAQNNYNRSGANKGSKSGIRNIYPQRDKWQVLVQKEGKLHYFGVYDDLDEAAEVAEQSRRNLFGEFAGRN